MMDPIPDLGVLEVHYDRISSRSAETAARRIIAAGGRWLPASALIDEPRYTPTHNL